MWDLFIFTYEYILIYIYIGVGYVAAKLGEILCSEGPVMAATDVFELEVVGKGGHGAMPQYTSDAIVTAANLVTSMQTIVSRNTDPLQSGVVTCGQINGGYAHNIIADKVVIRGTARSFTKEVQATIKGRMGKMCCGMECCYGGNIGMNYTCECCLL